MVPVLVVVALDLLITLRHGRRVELGHNRIMGRRGRRRGPRRVRTPRRHRYRPIRRLRQRHWWWHHFALDFSLFFATTVIYLHLDPSRAEVSAAGHPDQRHVAHCFGH